MGDETTVTFNGGNATVGAIGQGSYGAVTTGALPDDLLRDVHRRLAELRALLNTHSSELADPAGAQAAVEAAAEEVRTSQPQPGTMRILLNAVAGAAPAVTAITQSVRELIQLVATP
jgi:hypothetical protein